MKTKIGIAILLVAALLCAGRTRGQVEIPLKSGLLNRTNAPHTNSLAHSYSYQYAHADPDRYVWDHAG